MNEETLKRARWHQNSVSTQVLKQPIKYGGAVLATVECKHFFRWEWSLPSGRYGVASTRHAATRRVRAALREGLRAGPFSLKDAGKA